MLLLDVEARAQPVEVDALVPLVLQLLDQSFPRRILHAGVQRSTCDEIFSRSNSITASVSPLERKQLRMRTSGFFHDFVPRKNRKSKAQTFRWLDAERKGCAADSETSNDSLKHSLARSMQKHLTGFALTCRRGRRQYEAPMLGCCRGDVDVVCSRLRFG